MQSHKPQPRQHTLPGWGLQVVGSCFQTPGGDLQHLGLVSDAHSDTGHLIKMLTLQHLHAS